MFKPCIRSLRYKAQNIFNEAIVLNDYNKLSHALGRIKKINEAVDSMAFMNRKLKDTYVINLTEYHVNSMAIERLSIEVYDYIKQLSDKLVI